MSTLPKNRSAICLRSCLMLVVAVLAPGGASAVAQDNAGSKAEPVYREYKGVRIGMSVDEARQKLGTPQEKGDLQDFYVFSEKEIAQVFYTEKKVSAIAIMYTGEQSGAPSVTAVLGSTVDPKADGSVYKMIRYPKAGCWVSYSRTAGDSPLVTVTVQKLNATTP